MFSPAVQPVREEILRSVFETDEPTHEYQGEHTETGDETDISDADMATVEDTSAFSEADHIASQDMKDLEEHFNMYQAVRCNISLASFISDRNNVELIDYASAVSVLSPNDPEARHILYRLRGLLSLIHDLQAIHCTHPSLLSQRDDLIAASQLETERILASLRSELKSKTQTTTSGVRRVSVDFQLPNEYISPVLTSILMLVSIIHTIMGVARDNCNFILSSLRHILSMATKGQQGHPDTSIEHTINDIPFTLATVLHRMNLPPTFDLYAACPKCCELYSQLNTLDYSFPETCTAKDLDGTTCDMILGTVHRRGDREWKRPISRYSHMRFETWISELLLRPGVEDLLEAARPNPSPGPIASDVWDAPFLRTFPDPAEPFMDAPPGDLRLIMMLHFDFFNPFTNKTAGKVRSVGAFFMICLNLPPDIRYDAAYSYLVSVVPGPDEKHLDEINKFIKPIVDDMEEIYSPGIWVSRTHKCPHGRKVRGAIAIKSMDILAARGAGGFATHSHTCFCHLCNATRAEIDQTSLQLFKPRTIERHRQIIKLWEGAVSLAERKKIYTEHGVRPVDWLRFSWWNPFTSIVVGPMHWTKNVLDKQLRQNMEWSWDIPFGVPDGPSRPLQPITTLEYQWGIRAMVTLSASGLKNAKLTAPLLHYLCRQRKIYEAGLHSDRLINDLNKWRMQWNILTADGEVAEHIKEKFKEGVSAGVARAHYYVSKHPQSASVVSANTTVKDLAKVCELLHLPSTGQKAILIERLLKHYQNIRTPDQPNDGEGLKQSKTQLSVLGAEILSEVKQDMGRTALPSWLKHPPVNFATLAHGKIQAEEYKSLALVSFTITLVRLWGLSTSGTELRQRLDNFLHLMLAVRIVAFQSLTDLDNDAFDNHYAAYMAGLKELYPTSSVIPVQHLGMHISQFMRSMGPSTRWSESTCEQFVGMFQNICTNFKFGDLELTLHREFVMATRLKGMMQNESFTDCLGPFGQGVREFLDRYAPSQYGRSWQTSHSSDAKAIPNEVYQSLKDWASLRNVQPFPRRLFLCTKIRRGNVVYAPYTASNGNSCVLFIPPTQPDTLLPGRIIFILKEPSPPRTESGAQPQKPRIVLIVRAFKPLTEQDAPRDPYRNHPIVGDSGAGIIRLYYDDLEEESHLISPKDLVAHIAVCTYADQLKTISKDSIVVLSLDLKHARYE